ncbi:MAG TPA: hypothetical protein VKU01_23605 [Bryobacteraceae bacterium]|nr:hypothetical protein [Bryobacteraceae bacterium]
MSTTPFVLPARTCSLHIPFKKREEDNHWKRILRTSRERHTWPREEVNVPYVGFGNGEAIMLAKARHNDVFPTAHYG